MNRICRFLIIVALALFLIYLWDSDLYKRFSFKIYDDYKLSQIALKDDLSNQINDYNKIKETLNVELTNLETRRSFMVNEIQNFEEILEKNFEKLIDIEYQIKNKTNILKTMN